MVKKLILNCNFSSGQTPVNFYVGNPSDDSHPIHFQSQWLASEYGGEVPKTVMDSMKKLHKISVENKLDFGELCQHVFNKVNEINSITSEKSLKQKQIASIKKMDPMSNEQPVAQDVNNEESQK